jgi:hypothetical protein
VLTKHGQQKASKAFHYQICVLVIDRECRWLYEKLQVASILRRHVTIKESYYRLGALSCLPPLSLVDMLHANGGNFRT